MSNTLITPAPVVHTLEDGTVFSEKSRRCIRGIPIGSSIWLPGDGPAGEPSFANDNLPDGRWPLREEHRAGRLGASEEEGRILWSTATWFAGHYHLANRAETSCKNSYRTISLSGELGEVIDDETSETARPDGIQFERDPMQRWFGVDPNTIPPNGRDLEALFEVEQRLQSRQICQRLKYRMDVNYKHVVSAVIDKLEMRDIARFECAADPAAGRMLVRAGLRTASCVRSDLERWADRDCGLLGPLPDKPEVYPKSMRRAANEDMRQYVRDIAA